MQFKDDDATILSESLFGTTLKKGKLLLNHCHVPEE